MSRVETARSSSRIFRSLLAGSGMEVSLVLIGDGVWRINFVYKIGLSGYSDCSLVVLSCRWVTLSIQLFHFLL